MVIMNPNTRGLDKLQKISMSLMAVLVVMTFVGSNIHSLLWQSSDWLVSTVLPAVVIDLTNQERADSTKSALVRNSTLDEAAQMKAEHMAKNQYFSHFSPKGVSPWYWFDEAGYVYAHAGENLAIHFTDSSEVVDAWMKSPAHRQNIVSGLYTEIGVGTAKGKFDGYNTVYVVQLFGAPAVVPVPTKTPTPEAVAVIAAPSPEPILVAVANDIEIPLEADSETVLSESISEEEFVVEQDTIPEPQPTEVAEKESFIPVAEASDTVVVESSVITTSSGLEAAEVSEVVKAEPSHAGRTMASIITQPNVVLQMIYALLALVIVSMLGVSVVYEARRYHFQQVAYGIFLLVGMTGLLFAHSFLTIGAVIV
jgi:hypothetical protein